MENIVNEYESISNAKLARIYGLNNVFVIVAIAGLLAEALLIFLPIIQKSNRYLSQINEKNQLLSNQNQSLKESEEKFRFIAENTSDGIMVYENGRITYTSPTYDKMIGLPHEVIVQRTAADLYNAMHPEDRTRVKNLYKDSFAKKIPYFSYEYRTLYGNENYVWRENKVTALYKTDGKMYKSVVLTRNITKRKHHEAKRIEREQMLSSLFDATHDMIVVLDVVGIDKYKFAYFNKTYQIKTGTKTKEFVGKYLEDKIPASDLTPLLELYRQCVATKKPINWLLVHDYPVGRLTCDATLLPILDEAGNCKRIVASVYDLTERYAYIKAVEEQNQQLKEIAWTQSHIVRAPLAQIMGIIRLLTAKSDNIDYHKTLFPRLLASANELDTVVHDIVAKANEVGEQD
jgi:PAS domain S-box-containing protein